MDLLTTVVAVATTGSSVATIIVAIVAVIEFVLGRRERMRGYHKRKPRHIRK
jgi:hypothetical protein